MAQLLSTEARHLSWDGCCVVCGRPDGRHWDNRLRFAYCSADCYYKLVTLQRDCTQSERGRWRQRTAFLRDLKDIREGRVSFKARARELGHKL